jgi:hypothetical protein
MDCQHRHRVSGSPGQRPFSLRHGRRTIGEYAIAREALTLEATARRFVRPVEATSTGLCAELHLKVAIRKGDRRSRPDIMAVLLATQFALDRFSVGFAGLLCGPSAKVPVAAQIHEFALLQVQKVANIRAAVSRRFAQGLATEWANVAKNAELANRAIRQTVASSAAATRTATGGSGGGRGGGHHGPGGGGFRPPGISVPGGHFHGSTGAMVGVGLLGASSYQAATAEDLAWWTSYPRARWLSYTLSMGGGKISMQSVWLPSFPGLEQADGYLDADKRNRYWSNTLEQLKTNPKLKVR